MDASALVKLMIAEAESEAVRSLVRAHPGQVSSLIVSIEVRRAAARAGVDEHVLDDTLDRVNLIPLDPFLALRAARLLPPSLRTLDAIHLSTALELGGELDALVTYDRRLADAARGLGIRVESPS